LFVKRSVARKSSITYAAEHEINNIKPSTAQLPSVTTILDVT